MNQSIISTPKLRLLICSKTRPPGPAVHHESPCVVDLPVYHLVLGLRRSVSSCFQRDDPKRLHMLNTKGLNYMEHVLPITFRYFFGPVPYMELLSGQLVMLNPANWVVPLVWLWWPGHTKDERQTSRRTIDLVGIRRQASFHRQASVQCQDSIPNQGSATPQQIIQITHTSNCCRCGPLALSSSFSSSQQP